MSNSVPSPDQPPLPDHQEDLAELGESEKLLLSPSAIISYMNDPARYYFRKIRKIKEPAGKALVEGSAYHEGIEFVLNHKFTQGVMPPMADLFTFIDQYWEERVKGINPDLAPSADRLPYVKNFFFHLLYDRVAQIDPKYVEHYMRVDLPQRSFNLHGYLDLVDSTNRHAFPTFDPRTDTLTDFKSRKNSPPKTATGGYGVTNFDRLQLTLYAYMLSKGQYSVRAKIIYLVKTKTPQIKESEVIVLSPAEQLARLNTVEHIAKAIEAGIFTPSYGSWLCSPEKCHFWEICHQTF